MISFGQMRFMPLLFFFFIGTELSAQTVQISNPIRLSNKTGKFSIVGKNNDGIVVHLYGAEDVIHVYTDDLKLALSRSIEFKNEDGLLQYILLNRNGAVVFYLSQDKRRSVLLAQPVNSKFIQIGNPIVIDTIYDRRDLVSANLRFCASTDQNYLFVYYPFFEGNTIQTIRYICVDHALHVQYNKTIPINRNESELVGSKALVDNEGSASIILKPKSGNHNEEFNVYRLDKNGNLNIFSIITQQKFFGESAFEMDDKNKMLTLCALYDEGTGKGESAANGFFFGIYDPQTGKAVREKYLPFSSGFMNELTGRNLNGNTQLYTFDIKKTILRNDGGALILAESFIKDTRESVVPSGMQPGYNDYVTSTLYQYNDIVAFSFSGTGELEWTNIMRKKQVSQDDNGVYSSFTIMNQKNELHLLYLDDISTSGALEQYILSSDGKSIHKSLMNQEDHDLMMIPRMGKQISPVEMVLPSYKNGMLQLVKISF